MNNTKIAIITPSFPPKGGGIATSHYNLYLLFHKMYNVKVFVYADNEPENNPNIVKRKSPVWLGNVLAWLIKLYLRRYDKYGKLVICTEIVKNAFGVIRLNKPLRRFKPDIIIAPDNKAPVYFVRKPKNSKLIWFSHNNYLRFRNHPLINSPAWIDIDVGRSFERKALNKADFVLTPSKYMISEFHKAYPHKLPIKVIHNFIDTSNINNVEDFPLHQELQIDENVPVIYIPSAGSDNKGKRYVFEMVRRIAAALDFKVAFYLSGHIPVDLKYELDSVDDKIRIYAPGHVEWKRNLSVIKSCRICVSPTLVENFSNAFVEAFGLGLPIVTFDVGGNKEIIDSGKNGYIVPYIDIEMLISKTQLLLNNPSRVLIFSSNAKKAFNQLSDINKLRNQYRELINSIL